MTLPQSPANGSHSLDLNKVLLTPSPKALRLCSPVSLGFPGIWQWFLGASSFRWETGWERRGPCSKAVVLVVGPGGRGLDEAFIFSSPSQGVHVSFLLMELNVCGCGQCGFSDRVWVPFNFSAGKDLRLWSQTIHPMSTLTSCVTWGFLFHLLCLYVSLCAH